MDAILVTWLLIHIFSIDYRRRMCSMNWTILGKLLNCCENLTINFGRFVLFTNELFVSFLSVVSPDK
ncbi:unnamed protein product [Adineta ricciae]|uniref:Uncharacterized protein n=1 Tax=Adineta ricciae TaxID=249248 RepID=A0A814GU59_ADIRI|nr:unnamed protein product [Adineta ricciae]